MNGKGEEGERGDPKSVEERFFASGREIKNKGGWTFADSRAGPDP